MWSSRNKQRNKQIRYRSPPLVMIVSSPLALILCPGMSMWSHAVLFYIFALIFFRSQIQGPTKQAFFFPLPNTTVCAFICIARRLRPSVSSLVDSHRIVCVSKIASQTSPPRHIKSCHLPETNIVMFVHYPPLLWATAVYGRKERSARDGVGGNHINQP